MKSMLTSRTPRLEEENTESKSQPALHEKPNTPPSKGIYSSEKNKNRAKNFP